MHACAQLVPLQQGGLCVECQANACAFRRGRARVRLGGGLAIRRAVPRRLPGQCAGRRQPRRRPPDPAWHKIRRECAQAPAHTQGSRGARRAVVALCGPAWAAPTPCWSWTSLPLVWQQLWQCGPCLMGARTLQVCVQVHLSRSPRTESAPHRVGPSLPLPPPYPCTRSTPLALVQGQACALTPASTAARRALLAPRRCCSRRHGDQQLWRGCCWHAATFLWFTRCSK